MERKVHGIHVVYDEIDHFGVASKGAGMFGTDAQNSLPGTLDP